jgi:hypothetical protein
MLHSRRRSACRESIGPPGAARKDWLLGAIQEHLAPPEQAQLASALELLKRIAIA